MVFLDGCPLESGPWLGSVMSQGQDRVHVDVMLARPLLYLVLILI